MKFVIFLSLLLSSSLFAYEAQFIKGEMEPTLGKLLDEASRSTGVQFDSSNFMLVEDRNLATSRFVMYVQTVMNVPVAQTAVRIWIHPQTGELILAEVHLNENAIKTSSELMAKFQKAKFTPAALKSKSLASSIESTVSKEVSTHGSDQRILGMKFKDEWVNGDLVRTATIRGRRGVHTVSVSLLKNKVVDRHYMEFPQSEAFHSMKANVYPIYEEVEGTGERLKYETREIKYIHTEIPDAGQRPLGPLTDSIFSENKYSPILASTKHGQLAGFWSEASIRRQIEEVISQYSFKSNDFSSGLLLQGKYATINLHPEVKKAFPDVNFAMNPSPNHIISWGNTDNGMVARPVGGFLGKGISSQDELLSRIPIRHEHHDTLQYINSGVDEVQVYYGVTVLMESLAEMGFTDPELSTAPFHAFLFDPDIAMKDNAYYWDNTINFTTYSSNSPNYARDNATIWHELGHGVMDRLMGAHLGFADSKGGYGGLSEGMADFLADLVIEHQTSGAFFAGKNDMRIVNETGFYLTNEFHDEGEAYGGVMKDMLAQVLQREGRAGLVAFTDLTLEAMRLTRNHPALSARGWFEHMIIADELGSATRASGQYREIMVKALSNRNFAFDSKFAPADMKIVFNDTVLTNDSLGSREKPISACDPKGHVNYELKLSLKSGDSNFITFPAIVKVEYKKGALQGAINWTGEASNPNVYVVQSEEDLLSIPLEASMKCDFINTSKNSCKDYAYIQVWDEKGLKPKAKKRFYLEIADQSSCNE